MADVRWLDDREERAWRSLVAMQESLAEYLDRQLRTRCSLSMADFRVLAHLSESTAQRLRSFELAGLLGWEKGRLSQHLSRMQARSLVSREPCPDDRRGAVIVLTERGRALIESAAPQHLTDVRSAVVDQLTASELATLNALSDKIRRRLTALESEA